MPERLAPHGGCNWSGCGECFPQSGQVRRVTYTRTWTVEVKGTDDDWAEYTRQKLIAAGSEGEELETLDHIVQTLIGDGSVLSDNSEITQVEVLR
jgi:hypothetical protein